MTWQLRTPSGKNCTKAFPCHPLIYSRCKSDFVSGKEDSLTAQQAKAFTKRAAYVILCIAWQLFHRRLELSTKISRPSSDDEPMAKALATKGYDPGPSSLKRRSRQPRHQSADAAEGVVYLGTVSLGSTMHSVIL